MSLHVLQQFCPVAILQKPLLQLRVLSSLLELLKPDSSILKWLYLGKTAIPGLVHLHDVTLLVRYAEAPAEELFLTNLHRDSGLGGKRIGVLTLVKLLQSNRWVFPMHFLLQLQLSCSSCLVDVVT